TSLRQPLLRLPARTPRKASPSPQRRRPQFRGPLCRTVYDPSLFPLVWPPGERPSPNRHRSHASRPASAPNLAGMAKCCPSMSLGSMAVRILVMLIVMKHHRHPDEQRRQEREDERLQERDEQLEKIDRDAARHDDQ